MWHSDLQLFKGCTGLTQIYNPSPFKISIIKLYLGVESRVQVIKTQAYTTQQSNQDQANKDQESKDQASQNQTNHKQETSNQSGKE